MAEALSGLRVLEVGDFISAAYCTKLLADMGADVIKVEPPGGDSARRYGPFRGDVPDREGSGLYVYLNTNKRGITMDLEVPSGRALLDRLLDKVDILVENVDAAAVESLALDYPSVHRAHPGLIVTSISALGREGPHGHYRGYGLQGTAGSTAFRQGDPDRAPLVKPLHEVEFVGGLHGAVGTLLATLFHDRTSRAQHVDVSIQDALLGPARGQMVAMVLTGARAPVKRTGHRINSAFAPWTVLPVADGYMEFIAMQDRQWDAFIEGIGNPEWASDPRFRDTKARAEHAEELEDALLPEIRNMTRAEIWEISRARRASFQPVHRVDELVDSDHVKERQYCREVLDGESRPMIVPGAPYQFSGTPWAIRRKAPRLGEHTGEVLEDLLAISQQEQTKLRLARVI